MVDQLWVDYHDPLVFFREAAQEEASEDSNDGLVDMDDEEDKDESSFDERLGGSCSATTLRPP